MVKVLKIDESANPVFWLEAAALVAFGVSWLVKGEALLADKDDSKALDG